MLNRLNRQRTGRGFTLVELLIVILIIAILIAIAIPNFLGQRQKAGDRAAQQTLRTAMSSVKAYSSDVDSFDGLTPAKLSAVEPNIDWQATATANGNKRPVGVSAAGDAATMVAPGADEMCWFVTVHLDANSDDYGAYPSGGAACNPAAIPATATTQNFEFPPRP